MSEAVTPWVIPKFLPFILIAEFINFDKLTFFIEYTERECK